MLSSAPRDARVGVDAVDLRAENERLRARVLKLENALSAAGISIGGAHEGSSTVTASGPHRTAPCLPLAAVSQPTLVAPTNIATIAENGIDSLQRIGAAMHAELASESADSGATSERAEQFRFGHVSAAPSLDAAAIRRYSRQMILPCVGAVAQVTI